MSSPVAPHPRDEMQTTAPAGTLDRAGLAEHYLLAQLNGSSRSLPLAELVRRAAVSEHKFSAEETRGAVATLVDDGEAELTDDLHLRLRRSRHR